MSRSRCSPQSAPAIGMVITSGYGSGDGVATTTRSAPARSAARPTRYGAPWYGPPPTTSTRPPSPLCASRRRGASASRSPGPAKTSASSGIPIGATRASGPFGRWNASTRSALHPGVGTSAARIGAGAAFARSTIAAIGSRTGGAAPTPSRASTIRSAFSKRGPSGSRSERQRTRWTSTGVRARSASCAAFSGVVSPSTAITATSTAFARYRAATRPSPPLFPRPASTSTQAGSPSSAVRASAAPAASIICRDESPSATAFRSTARIRAGSIAPRSANSERSIIRLSHPYPV